MLRWWSRCTARRDLRPSCELCAELAAAEINAADGVLGRELQLSVIDGSAPPRRSPTRSARSPPRPGGRGRRLAHLRGPPGRRAARRRAGPLRLHRALRRRGAHARRLPDRRDPVAPAAARDAVARPRARGPALVDRRQRLRLAARHRPRRARLRARVPRRDLPRDLPPARLPATGARRSRRSSARTPTRC